MALVNKLADLNTTSIFNDLLKQELVRSLKTELMDVAEKEVDKIIERASGDFETSVHAFLSQFDYAEIINYNIKFKKGN